MSETVIFQTAESCLNTCCSIALVGTTISSLEFLSIRREFRLGGVFDWSVMRSSFPSDARYPIARWILEGLGRYDVAVAILTLRLVGSLCYLSLADAGVKTVSLALVAIGSLFLQIRCRYGLDGSDQMGNVIVLTGLLCRLGPEAELLAVIGLWFIAGQVCLAYLTAGVAKLVSPVWRSGRAIPGVLSSHTYGFQSFGRFLDRHPLSCQLIAWLVIAPECLFSMSLLGHPPLVVLLLAWGVLFHVLAAAVMGLNVFLWSFLATYPAVAFCAGIVR